MPRINLVDVEGRLANQSLDVTGNSQSENYEKLEQSLDIVSNDKKKAVVLDSRGAAVKLTEDGVQEASHFVVVDKSDLEIDATTNKWNQMADLDERAQKLRRMYSNSRQQNAAINGYTKTAAAGTDEGLMFPDYNKNIRNAYTDGLGAQIPAYLIARSDNSDRVAGLPHEPTIGEIENFKTQQLLKAYHLGQQNTDKKKDHLPSPAALREAHRRGKEAVCIRLSEQDFQRVDQQTFKTCSVPTEFAAYEGGANKSELDHADERAALRESYLAGVDDAWNSRKANCVTQVKSSDRVSDKPSLQDAFLDGVKSAKSLSGNVPGAVFATGSDGRNNVDGGADPQYVTLRVAFQRGLDAQWEALATGGSVGRADLLYPDTSQEERDARGSGLAEKRAADKDRDEERRAQEAEDEENKKNDVTMMSKICHPCIECKAACWPLTTKNAEGQTLLCGTTWGDWFLIVFLFVLYYLYLAMWIWALIEIMFVVAEPQRPH